MGKNVFGVIAKKRQIGVCVVCSVYKYAYGKRPLIIAIALAETVWKILL